MSIGLIIVLSGTYKRTLMIERLQYQSPMASMKITVAHLALCALLGITGIVGKPPRKIVHGDAATENECQYQVSLALYGQHMCGGSIIDATHVVTAAHCVDNKATVIQSMTVTTGTKDLGFGKGRRYGIKNVHVHPQYFDTEDDSWKNDIAVITLASPIEFDGRTKVVKLPTSDISGNEECIASGWGDTSFPQGRTPIGLRKLEMTTIATGACYVPGTASIDTTHLCARGRSGTGLCTGDSGGPLVKDGTLVGVASFAIPCGLGYPDVFTRVYAYVDWIKQIQAKS